MYFSLPIIFFGTDGQQEEGDYLVGQLLCHGALLRCGRLKGSVCAQVVRHILEVIKKRSYLLIPAYSILVDFLEKVRMS